MSGRHQRIDELFIVGGPRGSDRFDIVLPLLERARSRDHRRDNAIRPQPRQREFCGRAARRFGVPPERLRDCNRFVAKLGFHEAPVLAFRA